MKQKPFQALSMARPPIPPRSGPVRSGPYSFHNALNVKKSIFNG